MADNDSDNLGARARLEAAFGRAERRGLMQAAAARSAAVAVIIGWLAVANPDSGLAYAWTLGTACFFLVTGVAQFWLYWRELASPIVPYAFMLVDSLALAASILLPNPFDTLNLPPALPLRYASFMYFFVLLMQAAFSFRPRLRAGHEHRGQRRDCRSRRARGRRGEAARGADVSRPAGPARPGYADRAVGGVERAARALR
jgi:hypothetical protein